MTDVNYWGINGKIVPNVSGGILTVSIVDYDGSNFSSSNPLVYKIGDTPRILESALSVAFGAGNYFNVGSAELKTKTVNLFVYIGWRASNSSLFVLLSRIPYAKTYADFSATTTNQKYGIFSGGTTPASTDTVENIGRISVQNSGSASYSWTVVSNFVINRPIYETDWMDWVPVLAPTGGAITSYTINSAKYKLKDSSIEYYVDATITNNGTGNGYLTITYPWTPANIELGTGLNQGTFAAVQAYSTYIIYTAGGYPVATGDSFICRMACRI